MKGFLRCSLACLLELTWTTSLSAASAAWENPSPGTIVADLPPARFLGAMPRFSLSLSGAAPANRMTPLLDQFFASQEAVSRFVHRRSYLFDLGGTTIGIEALRLQSKAPDRLADRFDGAMRSRSSSIGARSDWKLGDNDQLSFGLATTDEHSAQSRMLAADPHIVTSVKTLGLTWSHRPQWQLSMGWQQTGGSSRGGTDRMVELASGAPLHESGMRFSLAFLPGAITDPHRTSLGIEARRESIASDDLALLGASRRQDMQGSLFLRTHF